MSGRRMLGVGLAAALCLGAVWTAGDRYAAGVFCRLTLAAAAAVGLDLTLGLTGQISLCHGAFMGLGAYAAGIFAVRYGPAGLCMGLLCGMGLAALTAGGTAWVCSFAPRRLLAVATLGLGEVLRVVFENLPAGGGVRGLTGIPPDDRAAFLRAAARGSAASGLPSQAKPVGEVRGGHRGG